MAKRQGSMTLPHAADVQVLRCSPGLVQQSRHVARTISSSVGFDARAVEEITIAASELASNLVKHARCGTLSLTPVEQDGRIGIQIVSEDSGPGISNIEQAMTDGASTAGSLGCGLGSVNRLMHEFSIESRVGA